MRAALPMTATLLLLSGCGYSPPPRTDGAAPQDAQRYEADLDKCRDDTATAVNKRNAKTGLAWFASPVTRWGQIGDGVSACMGARGYGRLRVCTAEELRTGGGSRTVTTAGVRCSDPPTPPEARPADTSPPAAPASDAGGKRRRP